MPPPALPGPSRSATSATPPTTRAPATSSTGYQCQNPPPPFLCPPPTTSTTKPPASDGPWTASDGGVELALSLENQAPTAGQLLTFDLHVHFKVQANNDWQWAQWGDQSTSPPDGYQSTNPDVPPDGVGQCEPAGTDLSFVYHRAYRVSGDWTFLVPYQYVLSCSGAGTNGHVVTIRGTVHVGAGPWLKNGPMPPWVFWSGNLHTTNCPSGPTVCVQETSADFDGWVDAMTLDWGDGSAPYRLTEAPPPSCEPANQSPPRPDTWPAGGLFTGPPISHTYPHAGYYTVTLYAHSEGCDGSQGQSATWTASVNAGGY